MVEPIPASSELNLPPPPRRDPFPLLWESLRRPLLLVGVAGFLLLLVIVGLALPQLPGQFADDPAGATRWLLTTRNEYGGLGTLLNGLGLFDLIHSPLIRGGLAVLGLLLLIHLGEQVADIQRSRQLPGLLAAAKGATGEPLPIPGSGQVFRSRSGLDASFAQMAGAISRRLGDRFDANPSVLVRRAQVSEGGGEMRWLVQGHAWAYYVRPLLLAGILLALAVLWGGVNFGWEVNPPPLAPGGEFRFPQRELHLRYTVLDANEGQKNGLAALQVELGDASQLLALGRTHTARLNNTTIRMESKVPGILVESDSEVNFLLPGQVGAINRIGFVFPAAGSEESVLIPDADMGLRLVRLAEEGRFLIETIAGEGGAVTRSEISQDESRQVYLVRGERAGQQITIELRLLPAVTVRVRYLPGDGLLWASLALVLTGIVGYVRRPYFALVQLGPWPEERSVLVVQSSSPEPLAELEGSIHIQ
ncbi:MAG: hypothetical protein KJZ86_20325 [Caldilineaceae bacterium]|nr:hypothetical protein [Caldilineaceae bacterium]